MDFRVGGTYPLSMTRAATSSIQTHMNQYMDTAAWESEAVALRCQSLERVGKLTLHGGE